MTRFLTAEGFSITGEVAEYFTSADGRHMARIRVAGSPVCVVASVNGLMVSAC